MIFKQRSFKMQVVAITMLTSVVSLVLAVSFLFGHEAFAFRRQTMANLSSLAQVIGANSAAALMFNDPASAQETLSALQAEPSVIEAALFHSSGSLFARYIRDERQSPEKSLSLQSPGVYSEDGFITVFQEIRMKKRELAGTVYLRSNVRTLYYQRLQEYAGTTIMILMFGIAVAVLLALRLHRIVSRPISALTQVVREVSDTRNYSVRTVDSNRNDEMGVLARGFNEMLSQIQERDRSLQEARDQLELKVDNRTKALRDEMIQRFEAQGKLEQQKRQAQQYLDIAAVMFVALNSKGEVIMVNRKCCELTGYYEAELVGKPWNDLVIPAAHRQDVRFAFDELMAGNVSAFEYHENLIVRKDGQERFVAWHNTAIRDENGRVIGTLSSGTDISDRRQMEHDLEETNRQLSTALDEIKATQEKVIQNERLRALGQMASGIAHDFNNALVPILGFSDYILNDPAILDQKDDLKQMIQDIFHAAQEAREVVRRLREFYRPADESEFTAVNVNELVAKSVALTRPKWKEEMAAAGITIDIKTTLTDISPIHGSESQITQALINLILNAVDAMRAGGVITIATGTEPGAIVLSVTDTGEGMTEEVRRRCLEPFFTTKRDRGGTGLGLPIVFGMVQRHRGQFEIQSQVGRGTTMLIRFPLATDAQAAEVKKEPESAPFSFPGLRVLMVDDDPRSQTILQRYLASFSCQVESAESGVEALRKLREGRFDLLVTDRAMPGISGDDLARAAKESRADCPVIMVTGFGDVIEVTRDTLPDNVDAVVGKPVRMSELGYAISRVVRPGNKPTGSQQPAANKPPSAPGH